MALVKTPYEILLRYNPDGTFQGAHVQWLFTDSDGLMSPNISNAVPLTASSDPAFTAVLGQALTDATSQVNTLTAQVAALQAQLSLPPSLPTP